MANPETTGSSSRWEDIRSVFLDITYPQRKAVSDFLTRHFFPEYTIPDDEAWIAEDHLRHLEREANSAKQVGNQGLAQAEQTE